MVDRARLSPPRTPPPNAWPWHEAKWVSLPASTLMSGERRFEADNYLSSGYGIRLAIENRANGWGHLSTIARTWQPSRLKGIQVSRGFGTPFLAATQVFDLRPTPRKFLSLERTDDAQNRFVQSGQILLTCSGSVGRATLAYRPFEGVFITHDLLRIDPIDKKQWGWIYAFLRSPKCRSIMVSAKYGHVIKHLEVTHLDALPIPDIGDELLPEFTKAAQAVLNKRNAAWDLVAEVEAIMDGEIGKVECRQDAETGFSALTSSIFGRRRRLEAAYHHPMAAAILKRFKKLGLSTETLDYVSERIWWLTRFKRVFGDEGMPYMSADELFSVNPTITKRVMVEQAETPEDYFVKAGWILMACSGQTYGLNGSVSLLDKRHEQYFFSHDIVRIIPNKERIRAGYLYAALGHPRLGRPLVIRHAYGTSIPHLDPGDVATIPIVRLADDVEKTIATKMEKAVSLRAEADELENALGERAEGVIDEFLHGA
jgi:type I restriction enzyme, S subunit